MEMEFCVSTGLPHSKFLGWPEDDQDKVVEYMLFHASKCHRCGTARGEWLDEDGKPVEPPPYTANSLKCYGCVTLDEAQKEIPKEERLQVSTFLIRRPKGEDGQWQMRRSR